MVIEHMLADRPGDWLLSIVAPRGNDRWKMRITGPNTFERSYTLEGSAGEHEPQSIARFLARMGHGSASSASMGRRVVLAFLGPSFVPLRHVPLETRLFI